MPMNLLAKIVLAGDGGVGKTTLVHRFMTNNFIDSTKMTIGVAFHTYQITYEDYKILLQIWDLGGQEQFKNMGIFDKYFNGATVSVIMFDLTRLKTLESIPEWADIAVNGSKSRLLLVGGKKDLPNAVSLDKSDLQDFFETYNFEGYVETSSATGEGVEQVFDKIAEIVVEINKAKGKI